MKKIWKFIFWLITIAYTLLGLLLMLEFALQSDKLSYSFTILMLSYFPITILLWYLLIKLEKAKTILDKCFKWFFAIVNVLYTLGCLSLIFHIIYIWTTKCHCREYWCEMPFVWAMAGVFLLWMPVVILLWYSMLKLKDKK